jgi:hypothetical protein
VKEGNEAECLIKPGELRPKWEMDKFCCSHRCLLSEVMVVRGALVRLTLARPVLCFLSYRRQITRYFLLLFFFLYRVFLPFTNFGRILRTFSI